ncbi:hypothetical protein BDF19DRAFT_411488 [Syncephalis fuscata]|nr:hypothetical protein BDF19DRAFT_411488 [Syncephalis fuscata]
MEEMTEKATANISLANDSNELVVKNEQPLKQQKLDEDPPADCEKLIAGTVPWSAWFIVGTELCERFAYYGSSLIFQTYMLDELHLPKNKATAINRGFVFLAYFTTVIGAIIADVKLGSSLSVGFGLPGFIIATYLFIASGTGGIKSNVSSFVADQVRPGFKPTSTPGIYVDSRLTLEGIFRYFYWAINVGSFLVPAIMFVLGILLFILGRNRYYSKPASPDILLKTYGCIKYALTHREDKSVEHWLHRAKVPGQAWDDKFVSDLAETLSACKVFFFYPFYWALYGNMTDCFISQGLADAPQLNLINAIVIIVAIPVMDSFIFPALRRCGLRLGPITRITIGFGIVTAGFVYVTVLQHFLYQTGPYYDFTTVPKDVEKPFNNLSVWWQVPPYIAIGISEIFASATGLEFAYKRATPELKSIVMSLFLLTNCGGSLIGLILAEWSTDPYFVTIFGIETAAMAVVTAVFYWCFRHLDNVVV